LKERRVVAARIETLGVFTPWSDTRSIALTCWVELFLARINADPRSITW